MSSVVTGVGLALPGADSLDALVTGPPDDASPVDAAAILGKKGLRYRDRATQLGYCAAKAALTDAGLLADELLVPAGDVAVIVSSNLGNLATVCKVVSTIVEEDGTKGLSPMDTPNASSNVPASAIALRFGLRGPNMMLCSGPTSGVDALRWATVLLAGRRARHVLVVGVEPDDETTRRMLGAPRVLDGAAAVVVEPAAVAAERGVPQRLRLGGFARGASVRDCLERLGAGPSVPSAFYVPETDRSLPADLFPGVRRRDLADRWGPASGALGVLQCATAAAELSGTDRSVYAVAGGDEDDASAGMVLLAPGGPAWST